LHFKFAKGVAVEALPVIGGRGLNVDLISTTTKECIVFFTFSLFLNYKESLTKSSPELILAHNVP
jgi:hypothetical protein